MSFLRMGISYFTSKRVSNVKQSIISNHLLTCDCNISFNDFTILSKGSSKINLLIEESSPARFRDDPTLNKTVKPWWEFLDSSEKMQKFQNVSGVRPGSSFSFGETSRKPIGDDMKIERREVKNAKLSQKYRSD